MVDARVDVEFGQPFIDMTRPAFAPMSQQLGPVPVADFCAKPVFADFAHGEHDMGVRLDEAIRAEVPMDIEVSDHAAINKLGLHNIAGKIDALLLSHLARNCELDFAGKLRVLAPLGRFNLVPQG
jgi:hypothetical protein